MYDFDVRLSRTKRESEENAEKKKLFDKLYSLDTRGELEEVWSFLDVSTRRLHQVPT